jgi:hypothetical protein
MAVLLTFEGKTCSHVGAFTSKAKRKHMNEEEEKKT